MENTVFVITNEGTNGGIFALLAALSSSSTAFFSVSYFSLCDLPHGLRQSHGSVYVLDCRSGSHPPVARASNWTIHPRRTPQGARQESWDAHHGWRAHRDCHSDPYTSVGSSYTQIQLACGLFHSGLRCYWICRRLY